MSRAEGREAAVEIVAKSMATWPLTSSDEDDARAVVAALDAAGWLRDPGSTANQAAVLHRDGLTHCQIADLLGVTPRQARRLAREGQS